MVYNEEDKKLMKSMAENLENYLDLIENYIIIKGLTKDEYDNAVKTVRKLIKKLKKGKGDDVFDEERFLELKENGKLDYRGL